MAVTNIINNPSRNTPRKQTNQQHHRQQQEQHHPHQQHPHAHTQTQPHHNQQNFHDHHHEKTPKKKLNDIINTLIDQLYNKKNSGNTRDTGLLEAIRIRESELPKSSILNQFEKKDYKHPLLVLAEENKNSKAYTELENRILDKTDKETYDNNVLIINQFHQLTQKIEPPSPLQVKKHTHDHHHEQHDHHCDHSQNNCHACTDDDDHDHQDKHESTGCSVDHDHHDDQKSTGRTVDHHDHHEQHDDHHCNHSQNNCHECNQDHDSYEIKTLTLDNIETNLRSLKKEVKGVKKKEINENTKIHELNKRIEKHVKFLDEHRKLKEKLSVIYEMLEKENPDYLKKINTKDNKISESDFIEAQIYKITGGFRLGEANEIGQEGCPCCMNGIDLDEAVLGLTKLDAAGGVEFNGLINGYYTEHGASIGIGSGMLGLAIIGMTAAVRNIKGSIKTVTEVNKAKKQVNTAITAIKKQITEITQITVNQKVREREKKMLEVVTKDLKNTIANLKAFKGTLKYSEKDAMFNIFAPGILNGLSAGLLGFGTLFKGVGTIGTGLINAAAGVGNGSTSATMATVGTAIKGVGVVGAGVLVGAMWVFAAYGVAQIGRNLLDWGFQHSNLTKLKNYKKSSNDSDKTNIDKLIKKAKRRMHYYQANTFSFALCTTGTIGLMSNPVGWGLVAAFAGCFCVGMAATIVLNNIIPRKYRPRNGVDINRSTGTIDGLLNDINKNSKIHSTLKKIKKKIGGSKEYNYYKGWKIGNILPGFIKKPIKLIKKKIESTTTYNKYLKPIGWRIWKIGWQMRGILPGIRAEFRIRRYNSRISCLNDKKDFKSILKVQTYKHKKRKIEGNFCQDNIHKGRRKLFEDNKKVYSDRLVKDLNELIIKEKPETNLQKEDDLIKMWEQCKTLGIQGSVLKELFEEIIPRNEEKKIISNGKELLDKMSNLEDYDDCIRDSITKIKTKLNKAIKEKNKEKIALLTKYGTLLIEAKGFSCDSLKEGIKNTIKNINNDPALIERLETLLKLDKLYGAIKDNPAKIKDDLPENKKEYFNIIGNGIERFDFKLSLDEPATNENINEFIDLLKYLYNFKDPISIENEATTTTTSCCGGISKSVINKYRKDTSSDNFELKNIERLKDNEKENLKDAIIWFVYFKYRHEVRDKERAGYDHWCKRPSEKN